MSVLATLLESYRTASVTEREKGTYFEELICAYLRNEATYRDLYDKVWMYGDWAKEHGQDGRDTGIDLVACSGLMKPDTHLGENARHIEVSDDQATSCLFR